MVNDRSSGPRAPSGLREEAHVWWRKVVADYELSPSDLKLHEIAARSLDRILEARESLAKNGLTFTDRHGCVRPRPESVIERNSAILFSRMLRELRLSDADEPEDEAYRLPRNRGTISARRQK